MDATTQQQKVDQLTQQVQADQTQLSTDQASLAEAQAELNQVNLINQLEALTPDEVTAINAALASDPANISGITLTVPNATQTAPAA